MKKTSLIATAIAALATTSAFAVDPSFGLTSEATYMINKTSAATTNTLTGHIVADRKEGAWTQQYVADAVGVSGSSNIAGQTVANTERYYASAKLASDITTDGTTNFFAKLQAEKDRQSNYNYNAALTVGLGHTFIADNIQKLTGEVGLGNRFAQYNSNIQDGRSFNEVVATAGAHYDRKVTPQLVFSQDLVDEYGSSLNTLRSRTALTFALTENISALASYVIKSERSSVDGQKNTENNQLVTFGVKYKY